MTQPSPFFEPQSLSMQQTEIDRLRTDLEIFMTSNAGLTSDVLALRAINAELLAALEAIVEGKDDQGLCHAPMSWELRQMGRAAIERAKNG